METTLKTRRLSTGARDTPATASAGLTPFNLPLTRHPKNGEMKLHEEGKGRERERLETMGERSKTLKKQAGVKSERESERDERSVWNC